VAVVTKKTINVEVSFYGPGRIVQVGSGAFRGGVPEPNINDKLSFDVHREAVDENGIWNPIFGEDTVEGGFQINLWGTSDGYRELAKYLLAIAELDSSADPDFHEHHEIISADGRTRLHVIIRKDDSER
jgi:hypothetical protein